MNSSSASDSLAATFASSVRAGASSLVSFFEFFVLSSSCFSLETTINGMSATLTERSAMTLEDASVIASETVFGTIRSHKKGEAYLKLSHGWQFSWL